MPLVQKARTAVETVYPLRHTPAGPTPFPTIYWLTNPVLVREMAELERRGGVRQLEAAIQEAPALRAAYHADQDRYRAARWTILTDADRRIVDASPSLTRAFRGGIAGIANPDAVKCLHAQYAFHLAEAARGGTAAGRWIDAVLHAPPV